MQVRSRQVLAIVGFVALLFVLIGPAGSAHAQATECGGPAPAARKSVAVCFSSLLTRNRLDNLAAASAFLSRVAAQGKSSRSALFALIRSELEAAYFDDVVLRSLLRHHEPFYRALCLPAPNTMELKLACADTAPWFQQSGGCPSIAVFLNRPGVRAGQCTEGLSRDLPFSDSCRSAARAGLAPDVDRLAAILQTPFGENSQCRAEGLKILCALRPEAALPVLNRWGSHLYVKEEESVAQCLLAMMETPGDRVQPEVREFLIRRASRSELPIELLRRTRPADRERLAPVVSALDPESDSYYWERAVPLLCEAPASARAISECQALTAKQKELLARQEEWRKQMQPRSSRFDVRYFRPTLITFVSLTAASLHVGLSVRYRDDPRNLGGFYAYQGALAGPMLITGISVFGAQARGDKFGIADFMAAILFTPIAAILAGVGGGYGGYRLGETPGNGRVAVGITTQAVILGTILGFTWGGRR